MTPRFLRAIAYTMQFEGGTSNVAGDAGGLTRFGISQRAYPDEDIRALTLERALALYYRDYWQRLKLETLSPWTVAVEVFDFGVNAGPHRAAQLLQQALNELGAVPALAIDGDIGELTRAALARFVVRYSAAHLLAYLAGLAFVHYRELALRDASQAKFLAGWARRAHAIPAEV